ncbi:MAG: hydroxysqualene dehydroxylase [Betaproteobacteria bacterium]
MVRSEDGSFDTLVVGGGIAGLACGVALADAGQRVALIERAARLGGRAASWRDAATGDVLDVGPHLLHSEYDNFLKFLDRLGTRGHIIWQPDKLITLATRDWRLALRPYRLPPPFRLLPDLLRAPGLSARDLWSNNRATLRAMRFGEEQVAELDQLDALVFLRHLGVSKAMIDWFWRLASMAVLNVPPERASAAALMRVHSQLIGHRGLHFGFPQAGLAELFAQQAAGAISSRGGTILMNAEAVEVHGGNAHARVRLLDGRRLTASHCVLALPPLDLRALRPELVPAMPLEPSPYVSTYLWFDRKLTQERFWALLCAPGRLNTDFYDLSNIRPALAAGPSVIASNTIYSHRASGLADDAIVAATLREIAEFAPQAAQARVRHAVVNRVPMAIMCPLPGFERKRPDARSRVARLLLAGDWLRTGLPSSMESAARSGYLAAEEILREAGRPQRLAVAKRRPAGLAALLR